MLNCGANLRMKMVIASIEVDFVRTAAFSYRYAGYI